MKCFIIDSKMLQPQLSRAWTLLINFGKMLQVLSFAAAVWAFVVFFVVEVVAVLAADFYDFFDYFSFFHDCWGFL